MLSNREWSGWPPLTIAAATTPATWVRSASPRFARGSVHYGFSNLVSRRGRGCYRTARLEGPALGNTFEHRSAVPHRRPADALDGRRDLLYLLCRGFIAGDRHREILLAVQCGQCRLHVDGSSRSSIAALVFLLDANGV